MRNIKTIQMADILRHDASILYLDNMFKAKGPDHRSVLYRRLYHAPHRRLWDIKNTMDFIQERKLMEE